MTEQKLGNSGVNIPENPNCHLSKEELAIVFNEIEGELKKLADLSENLQSSINNTQDRDRTYYDDMTNNVESLAAVLSRTSINSARVMILQQTALTILSGKYTGQCINCKLPIPFPRLKVLPEACRCIKCQGKYGNK